MSEGIPEKGLNMGSQPIAAIMAELGLKPHDLVAASTEQLTHKMVTKACNGRRLNVGVQLKVAKALGKVAEKEFKRSELFNY